MTTFAAGSRTESLRVVVTGTFDGETDLHEALDASGSGLEVVAWAAEVRDAVPYLGSGDVHAVLLGAGRDGDSVAAMLETDVAVIRLHTQAPIVLLVPEAHPDLVETAPLDDAARTPLACAEVIAAHLAEAGRRRSDSGNPTLHGNDRRSWDELLMK